MYNIFGKLNHQRLATSDKIYTTAFLLLLPFFSIRSGSLGTNKIYKESTVKITDYIVFTKVSVNETHHYYFRPVEMTLK